MPAYSRCETRCKVMSKLDKARRREMKRAKQKKMTVDGRGLVTDVPNWKERRKRERWRKQ